MPKSLSTSGHTRLPSDRVFLLQFRYDNGDISHFFAGRAEHIATGRTTRFNTESELIEWVKKVLEHRTGSKN
jgi:hypothetical protein